MSVTVQNNPGESLRIHIDLPPVPASRPRVGRFGTYYLKTYKKFRQQMEAIFAEYSLSPIPSEQALRVTTWVYVRKPKKTVRKQWWPKGDIDNYEKAVWDCLNKTVWEDDDQLVETISYKLYADENIPPCIILEISLIDEESDV